MNKEYISPDLTIIKLHLTADVLNVSDGENTGAGGGGNNGEFGPGDGPGDDLEF